MTYSEKIYGMKEITLAEAATIPDTMRSTRNAKVQIINACGLLRQAIDVIEHRAKGAPILDDQEHAELVRQFAELVKRAEADLWHAATFADT